MTIMPTTAQGSGGRLRAVVAFLSLSLAPACDRMQATLGQPPDEEDAPHAVANGDASPSGRREFGDTSARLWKTVWRQDGNDSRSALLYPIALVASRSGVYVLDAATGRVTKYDIATGQRSWSYPDSSSKEPRTNAVSLALDAKDNVVLLGRQPGRITTLDGRGALIRSVRLPAALDASSVCPRSDGRLLLGLEGNDMPLATVGSNGETQRMTVLRLPWPPLADGARIGRQFRLISAQPGDHCALTVSTGLGFVDASHLYPSATHEYVEPLGLPRTRVTVDSTPSRVKRVEEVLDHRLAAQPGTIDGGSLILPFEGLTPLHGRLIDLYAWPSGAYQRSLVFPSRAAAVARVGDTYFVLTQRRGAPVLIAARHP